MSRLFSALVLFALLYFPSIPVAAQPELVARAVSETRCLGNEEALVQMAAEIGPAGIAECLERASRSGRVLCAQASRYLVHSWGALPVLTAALRDHDRQVASRAAESMVIILENIMRRDLGFHELSPDEIEALLATLRETASVDNLSLDIRAQIVAIYGALARLVGASLDVSRDALDDEEVAVRRVAVGTLIGSEEPDDVAAMVEAVGQDEDLLVVTQAGAGICEVTLGAGRPLPAPVEERLRALLTDPRARPSHMRPLLVCLARLGPDIERAAELRALAARHPNEATRAVWQELNGETGGEE